MRIAYGSDEVTAATAALQRFLIDQGHEVFDVAVGQAWVEVGKAVATAVVGGAADLGIVWCWTGTGVSIAANKISGCRAALCSDAETARGARRWNDANVLALSIRSTAGALSQEIADAFLSGTPDIDTPDMVLGLEPLTPDA